jgi:oligopeptide transport system substrate-binding protein
MPLACAKLKPMGLHRLFKCFGYCVGMILVAGFAEAKTLHLRLAETPITLDWNGLATTSEASIVNNIGAGLFEVSYPSAKLQPGLASQVKKSKDKKEYTFTIRSDAKWSDGKSITAEDFITSWKRTLSHNTTSNYSYYLFDIENAKEFNSNALAEGQELGLKAIDAHTLRVKLSRPVNDWEKFTSFWPLFPTRADLVQKYGENWSKPGVIVTSGPFVVESYEDGKKMTLTRNPYYPKSRSNVDRVEISFIYNHDEAFKLYREGALDMLTQLPSAHQLTLSKRSDYHLGSLLQIHSLIFNTKKYPMNNREFRLALQAAVDPSKILPPNLPQFRLAKNMVPPPLPGSQGETRVVFNVAEAKKHLKKSGIVLNGKSKIAHGISKQIKDNLGLEIEVSALQNHDYTTYIELGDYHMISHTWSPKVMTSEDILLRYSSVPPVSRTYFVSKTYDLYVYQAMAAETSREKASAFTQAEKLMSRDEGVQNVLFFEMNNYLSPKTTRGIYFDVVGAFILKDAQL